MESELQYKFLPKDRSYSEWEFLDTTYFKPVQLEIDPIKEKLLPNDIIALEKGIVKKIHSTIFCQGSIPGVLILEGNKTYGKVKNRHYYKCIPDDIRIPSILVPYEIKHMGFSKSFKNKYVIFDIVNWENKHIVGILKNTIGDVDEMHNFYEYQLYCKSLNASIQKFNKDTLKKTSNLQVDLFEDILQKYPTIENRLDVEIISIDPEESVDLDDAMSVQKIDDHNKLLSIYISNVSIWMDYFQLWESFSRRISTIYLPDKKRPMLPTLLSDSLCSLLEGKRRFAFCMDVLIKDNEVKDISFKNTMIKVKRNYRYEQKELLYNKTYNSILSLVLDLNSKYNLMNHINNSHDLVNYLMLFMNYECAKNLIEFQQGIFRSAILKPSPKIPSELDEDIVRFIKVFNNTLGQYINASDIKELKEIRHDLLNFDSYIHITSPIRRLVDLLNMIKFQKLNNIIQLSDQSEVFYNNWLKDLDYINITMRTIRKVQIDCNLLNLFITNPELMEDSYKGCVFHKIERNDGLFQYNVYIPKLNVLGRITTRENYIDYNCKQVKLFLFNDEAKFKKKIRLQIL
jgi:hypothetical protein